MDVTIYSAKAVILPRKVTALRPLYWMKEAFALFRRQPLVWIIFLLVSTGLGAVASIVPVIGFVTAFFVQQIVLGALLLMADKAERGERINLESLGGAFCDHWQSFLMVTFIYLSFVLLCALLGVSIVMGVAISILASWAIWSMVNASGLVISDVILAAKNANYMPIGNIGVGISLAVVLGLLALVVLFFFAGAFYFAPALILFAGQKPWAAVKISLKAVLINWPAFLVISVLNVLLLLVGFFALFVGLLIVIPVIMLANYSAWKDIFEVSA